MHLQYELFGKSNSRKFILSSNKYIRPGLIKEDNRGLVYTFLAVKRQEKEWLALKGFKSHGNY